MRTLLILAVAVACAVAADISVQYAGTTTGAATWFPPVLSSGSTPCSTSTTAYSYVTFNATFPTAGVREVSAMAERQFKSYIEIFVYRGGFPAATAVCSNLAHAYDLDNEFGQSGGPVIDAFVYFAADTYTFVVTGDNGGIFAAHVDPSDGFGQTTAASPTWSPPSYTTGDTECSSSGSSEGYGFGSYSWTQATTGQFDVFVFFQNDTVSDDQLYTALYHGNPTTALIQADSCNASTLLATFEASSLGLYYPAFNLTAGQNYTLVFSLDSENFGYWGVHVIPTRIRYFDGITGFTQPRDSDIPSCTANTGYSNTPYGITFFTAQESVYILDTADPPSPFDSIDTYSFLYDGVNTGSPPASCPIFAPLVLAGDTGDVTPIYSFTNPGSNYTVIVSSYSSSPSITTANVYVLYFFTGLPIGAIPSGTTSGTGDSTTGNGATTGNGVTATTGTGVSVAAATSTGAGVTVGLTTRSTTGSKVTGSASRVGVAAALCLVAISALL